MNREFVERQMALLGLDSSRFDVLQDKAGVTVARVNMNGSTAVLKCFEDQASRREISNYRLLSELDVPALEIYASTDAALLMEDIASGGRYRLAEEKDMAETAVAEKLAQWYKKLHSAGFGYVAAHGSDMYSENMLFTAENIERVRQRSGTEGLRVWRLIENNFANIRRAMDAAPMTVTYNDFYYTNMAVARDGSSAIMFDYNLLGKGHVYSDMRNVTSSLYGEAAEAFLAAYGEYDAELEKLIDDAISPVITLFMAYQRAEFPCWANETLSHLKAGYTADVEKLLNRI